MAQKKYRVLLPLVFGVLAAALIVWDFYNESVIESMGMAWDTGAPIWPYQTSWMLLFAVNTPAYIISAPIFKLVHIEYFTARYPILFMSIIFWWWWIGSLLDFGFLGKRRYLHPKRWIILLAIAFVALVCAAALFGVERAQLWLKYNYQRSFNDYLSLLTTIGPLFWCLAAAFGTAIAALQLIRGRDRNWPESPSQNKPSSWRKSCLVLLFVLAVIAGRLLDPKDLPQDNPEMQYSFIQFLL
jgi:hypothetical protein